MRLWSPPQHPSLLLGAAGSRMEGIQEIAQLLVLSCQAGTGSEGSPGSTTSARGSSAGRDEAGEQREASGVTRMGCDRHCQHSVGAARAVGKPSSAGVKGTRSGWCHPAGPRAGWCPVPGCSGAARGARTPEQRGAGSGCRLGCQAAQKEQRKVSDSVFLPPDEVRYRMSRVPWAAASLSSPGRRGRLALLCQSSLGRRTGCFSCCGCAASADK